MRDADRDDAGFLACDALLAHLQKRLGDVCIGGVHDGRVLQVELGGAELALVEEDAIGSARSAGVLLAVAGTGVLGSDGPAG